MFFAGVFIAALSLAQEVRATPMPFTDADEVPAHPEITAPPKALGFWATPAKNVQEWALLNHDPRVGRRQVKSDPADLLKVCGANYVDCGGDYCCPSGNTCFTETLTNTIKCNPISVGSFGNIGGQTTNLESLISEYNSLKSEYPKLLSNFPDIATTGSFNYNNFVSQYYSALNSLTSDPSLLSSILYSATGAASNLFATPTNTGGTAASVAAGAAGAAESSGGSSPSGEKTTKKKTNLAPIIGGVVGGVVVLALIGGLIAFFVIKKRKDKRKKAQKQSAGAGGSPPSSAEKPGAYAQQQAHSVPATPGQQMPMGQLPMGHQMGQQQMGQQQMGHPPVGQYPQTTMSPAPPSVSPIGVMGGLPAVPQPGQFQQTPSPNQYGNYPPPSMSPPPPGVSPVPMAGAAIANDPNKGYFPHGQQYAEMPGGMPGQQQGYPPQGQQQQQPHQMPYQDAQHQGQAPYQQGASPGVPQPHGGQPPYYAQQPQGPVAEMDATGGR